MTMILAIYPFYYYMKGIAENAETETVLCRITYWYFFCGAVNKNKERHFNTQHTKGRGNSEWYGLMFTFSVKFKHYIQNDDEWILQKLRSKSLRKENENTRRIIHIYFFLNNNMDGFILQLFKTNILFQPQQTVIKYMNLQYPISNYMLLNQKGEFLESSIVV